MQAMVASESTDLIRVVVAMPVVSIITEYFSISITQVTSERLECDVFIF